MADQLTCVVVTPETTVIDEAAEFVALPLYDGELGVMPGRAPLIGRLGYGELRLRSGSKVSRFYIDGGFVQIADNVVSVLTNRAIPAERVNVEAATQQLETAIARVAPTDEAAQARERQIEQSRAQIRVAARK